MGVGSVPSRLTRTERARNASGEGSGKTIGSAPAADTEGRKTKQESAKKDTTTGSEGDIGRGRREMGRWEGGRGAGRASKARLRE